MTRNMFPLRMKRMTLTFCFRLTLYYPTIPDQEQIVQTYSNPFSNHECLGFVMIVGNVMIYHRSLFWGNHSKIIHILHIVDGTKSCTSWGWSFIPPFTWFYTSFRWLAGFLNHQQCECTGHPTDSVAIPKPFTNPWRESCGFILVHFVASLLVATNCWMTFRISQVAHIQANNFLVKHHGLKKSEIVTEPNITSYQLLSAWNLPPPPKKKKKTTTKEKTEKPSILCTKSIQTFPSG